MKHKKLKQFIDYKRLKSSSASSAPLINEVNRDKEKSVIAIPWMLKWKYRKIHPQCDAR